jgi:lipopolysaccharide/colanic/teichoic acid biosynthesis glycosyltransferase
MRRRSGREHRLKRCLDVVLSACGLVVLAPLMAVVALAIRLTMGPPVLFRHTRPGLHGRPFVMLKFRTMTNARGEDGELLPADQRLTRLGILLRRWSIDELPELWNVLRGEMSLVGPRPLLMEYLPRYSPEQMRRHDMRPGMTGLAQIKGRHRVGWDERFRLDVAYVDRWSLRLDAAILRATIGVVFEGQGEVNPKEEDHLFMGSKGAAAIVEPLEGYVKLTRARGSRRPAQGRAPERPGSHEHDRPASLHVLPEDDPVLPEDELVLAEDEAGAEAKEAAAS